MQLKKLLQRSFDETSFKILLLHLLEEEIKISIIFLINLKKKCFLPKNFLNAFLSKIRN